MKTVYYTFTTWDDDAMAAGFDGAAASRQSMMVRQPERQAVRPAKENVIDLNAWRSAGVDEPWAEFEESQDQAEDGPEPALPAPRPRRDHRRAMVAAELVSTLCVAAAAAVLIVRVLAF